MRVVCDQCAATYRVPNARLTKPINKATCKQCGSRLLIPKPQPGADPDERVVVPAVPAGGEPLDPGAEVDDDKTVPVVKRRPALDDGPALISGAPIGAADRERLRAAADRRRPAPSVPMGAPTGRTVAPATTPPPAPGGMGMAFAGAAAVLVGVVLQAFAGSPAVAFVAMFLTIGGAITAMFTLAFSNFGRTNARPGISLGLGLFLGLAFASMIHIVQHGLPGEGAPDLRGAPALPVAGGEDGEDAVANADAAAADDGEAAPAGEAAAPKATPIPRATPAPRATPVPAATPRPTAAAVATPAPRATPRPTPAPVATPRPTPAPVATPRPTPAPSAITPDPDPTPRPLPPPDPPRTTTRSEPMPTPTADGLPEQVKPEVIQMIVTSNVGVKRCFFEALKSREIVKPTTVNTSFNLSASGSASNLRVTNDGLSGSSLERCLDGAFRTMSFPPSQKGGPVRFPFKL